MNWQEVSGNWILIPPHPLGIIHFLGGAFVATAPHLTYRWLLENLADQGYGVIATPFVNTLDHQAIAQEVLENFEFTLEELRDRGLMRKRYLPIYGVGHSLGCKLHLLIGTRSGIDRAGNILISFNNFSANQAIPFMEQFNQFNSQLSSQWSNQFNRQFNQGLNRYQQTNPQTNPPNPKANLGVDFTPDPQTTKEIIANSYQIRRNLLVKFRKDDIDQTRDIFNILDRRFPEMVTMKRLPGTHITPIAQDIPWQAGREFTPFDALGQWVKQEWVFKEITQLKDEMVLWLNPSGQ
jgi:hypothetical protein